MASEAAIASASIDIQLETSRIESAITAGEAVSFDVLDEFVALFKELALPAPVPAAEPAPVNPDPAPASTDVPPAA